MAIIDDFSIGLIVDIGRRDKDTELPMLDPADQARHFTHTYRVPGRVALRLKCKRDIDGAGGLSNPQRADAITAAIAIRARQLQVGDGPKSQFRNLCRTDLEGKSIIAKMLPDHGEHRFIRLRWELFAPWSDASRWRCQEGSVRAAFNPLFPGQWCEFQCAFAQPCARNASFVENGKNCSVILKAFISSCLPYSGEILRLGDARMARNGEASKPERPADPFRREEENGRYFCTTFQVKGIEDLAQEDIPAAWCFVECCARLPVVTVIDKLTRCEIKFIRPIRLDKCRCQDDERRGLPVASITEAALATYADQSNKWVGKSAPPCSGAAIDRVYNQIGAIELPATMDRRHTVAPCRILCARNTRSAHRSTDFSISCSQKRMTVQPAARRAVLLRRSRARLPSSLVLQNATLVFGRTPWIGQQCQKHPSTKTAILVADITRSGRLPSRRRWRRYRIPLFHSDLRKSNSGVVWRPWIRPINRLRWVGVITSATPPAYPLPDRSQ